MRGELNTRLQVQLSQLVEGLSHRFQPPLGGAADPAGQAEAVEEQRRVHRRVRYLQRVAAGLPFVQADALCEHVVGFGSVVRVRDLHSRETLTYTLMTGEDLDLDAGEISMGSPVGHALLGRGVGDEVEVVTPQRRRRFLIISVDTVFDRLRDEAPPLKHA